ncbi:protein inturned-like [Biomphalaria glabrata]|uniref:Protein inturned n=1 Tax=Biomphalaria glabrata TaxID=6526 RepID=A0A9W3B3E4_BIOGL|nr:protein inturned-like [Biomphalaria glabrata]XP_055893980.1 protein inturned-like [Biomphalaria glabrata]XP_055893981.1 protein inturned-like [Biomphalaria glabrata]XP_055893982.1 protein inturned-like [Biomphalaria glabrata]XP_055893983.1 protein inturned-like [Biomphalaria glabrata]XP_055893984.1 protein inturned-like [Biomphalaria glabrata]XP_055893985.1 protein inturned-like [Biomphalaria glabrata]XP_055893986.1 protein inturned-like [Biomphalaria glabrata]
MSGYSNIKNSYISSSSWSNHVTNTVQHFTEAPNEALYNNYQSHASSKKQSSQQAVLKRKSQNVYTTNWNSDCLEDDVTSNSQSELLRRKSREIQEVLKKTSSGLMSASNNKKTSTSAFKTQVNILNDDSFDVKRSQLKHVLLAPDRRSLTGNESSGVEIFKKLFGITLFEYNNGKAKWNPSKDRKLVVQDVIEGSISYTTGKIHRGDMLVCINDTEVTWRNFTRLIHSLKKREPTKLTFQSPKIIGPKPASSILKVPEGDLCLAVLGKRLSQIQFELSQFKCVAMFLTLVPSDKEEDCKDDIVYLFPHDEEKLTSLRGLFMTICSFLVDVVDQPATCSHLTFPDGDVAVTYKQCGRDVLVFAMPENRIRSLALQSVIEAFVALMVLLFQDVKSAFSECDSVCLDKVLALMFHQALGLTSSLSPLTHSAMYDTSLMTLHDYHTARLITLSHENQLLCDEILTEFESMDFDNYLDAKDLFSKRQYVIQGTCLFYKEYIVCSHLLPQQQRHINLFMNCHGLLTLSARRDVSEVMVWQELKLYSSKDASDCPVGFKPIRSNTYLMIIGQKHYYLVVIVEGSDQSVPSGVGPSSLLEKQARVTLDQLDTEDVHMSVCCEERLNSLLDGVLLSSAEQLSSVSSPRRRSEVSRNSRLSSSSKSAADSLFLSRSKSADRMEKELPNLGDLNGGVMMRRHGSKLSYGSNDSAGSSSSTGPPRSKGSRVSSITDLTGIARSLSSYQIETPLDIFKNSRLGRGKENTLFSYIHFESGEGIMICPTEVELSEVHSGLQDQVMSRFIVSCCQIKALFTEQTLEEDASKPVVFNANTLTEKTCREAGVMFQCMYQQPYGPDRKQQISSLCFWVVGRRLQSSKQVQQEMYVCFHESTKQSVVEMAFSLGFGS